MEYLIKFGLGGGFGGSDQAKVVNCETIEEAEKEAFSEACDVYDQYDGSNGLRSLEEIMEEDELDEEEAQQAWAEERDSWLDYSAELYDEEKHKDLL